MKNKKRYTEVQRVVSPKKEKGQKDFKMFKRATFLNEALAEARTKDILGKRQNKRVQPSEPAAKTVIK